MPMFDTRHIASDFSEAAKRYALHATLQARVGQKLIEYTAPYLAADALLLDVGAGSGEVTRSWPARAVALDLAQGMCAEALAKMIPAMRASAENLPVRAGAVDVVASNLMLQWLGAPGNFFEEAMRVLKPGGILAVSSFTEGTLNELARAFADAGEHHRTSDFSPPAALQRSIKQAGFDILYAQPEIFTEHYSDMLDLCLYLRAIGANNKRLNRPRGMLTMRKLRQVASGYPQTEQGFPASWVVQYMIARKA